MSLPDFEPSLQDLQEHLPLWWRASDPSSELYKVLAAAGSLLDEINVLWTQPFLDAVLSTASDEGLTRNFAFAWGLLDEKLPPVVDLLRAYIAARAAEDGTVQSLVNTLNQLLDDPANLGGPIQTFPLDGSGLTLPANGAGLVLYQWTSPPLDGMQFGFDGTGITFPSSGGVTFGTFVMIDLLPSFPAYTLTIEVLSYLAFDRGAFQRAVKRFQPSDWLPIVVQETTQF